MFWLKVVGIFEFFPQVFSKSNRDLRQNSRDFEGNWGPNLFRFGKYHRQDMPPASVQAETSASKISPNLKRFGSHWFGNTHRQNMLLQAFKARTSASKISPNLKRFGSHWQIFFQKLCDARVRASLIITIYQKHCRQSDIRDTFSAKYHTPSLLQKSEACIRILLYEMNILVRSAYRIVKN